MTKGDLAGWERSAPRWWRAIAGATRRLLPRCAVALFLVNGLDVSAQQTVDELDAAARRAFAAGDFKQASDLAKQVYEIRKKTLPPGDQELATAAFNAGTSLRRAGEYAEAVPYLEVACDTAVAQFGDMHPSVGGCLLELAEALAGARQISRSKDVASRALRVIEKSYPAEGYAAAVFHAGEIFRDVDEIETALQYFDQAAHLYEPSRLNHPDFLMTSLTESGQLLHKRGRYAEAASALERAISLDLDRSGPLDPSVMAKMYLLADCYRQTGDYDKALALLDQVASALTDVHVEGHIAADDILLQIADLEYENGGSSQALSTVQRVLAHKTAATAEADRSRRVQALDLQGRVYAELHQYDEAEQSFRSAVQEARGAAHGAEELSEALTELGFFMLRRGRYAEAHACFDEALPIVERTKGRGSPEVAALLERLAVGLINQSDCDSARPVIERARKIYLKIAPKSAEMVEVLKMASLCASNQAGRSATMAAALRLQQQVEGGTSVAWLVASAVYHEEEGDLAKAAAVVQRALEFDPGNAEAQELLASILEVRGSPAKAAELLRELITRVAGLYGEDSVNVAARRFNLGRTLLRAGDEVGARESFLAAATGFGRHVQQLFGLLSLAEQQQLLAQQTAVQVGGVLSVCQDDPCLAQGYAVIVPWKGLIVDGLRRQSEIGRSIQARASEPAVASLRTVRTQLALWSSSRESRAYEEWKKKHDALTAEKEALERTLLASDGTIPDPGNVTLEKLRGALRETEALVDIYKFDQFGSTATFQPTYAAVITSRNAGPRFIKIGPAGQIEPLVARWIASVDEDRSDAEWAALKRGVWEPIQRGLPAGTRTVCVSGDSDLVRIPWHELATGGRVEVVEVDSARSLVNARSRVRLASAKDRLVIVGGLDYDAGRTLRTPGQRRMPFQPLQWTKKESEMIERLARENGMDAEWLTDAGATKAAVLTHVRTGTYLHFATHGFVPEQEAEEVKPGRWMAADSRGSERTPLVDSGLALSGANVRDPISLQGVGILTAEEILGEDMSRAKLVVLSACNTGLGVKASGQGILGLRSSLQAAGARKIVMSLWAVDDEATQVLMSSFYRKLWTEKKPLLQAFHEAQETVRRIDRFRAPRFWAGWSIIDPE